MTLMIDGYTIIGNAEEIIEFIKKYEELRTYPWQDTFPSSPLNPNKLWMESPNPIPINSYDCDKCPNKPDWTKPIIGDTPCTWCPKNTPNCNFTYTSKEGDKKYDK